MFLFRINCLAAALAFGAAVPAAMAAHVLQNGRITVVLGDSSAGLTAANSDRVDAITWVDSSGTPTGNLASNGGPLHCNDPQEFFGQSYGDSGNATPYFVVAGTESKWTKGAKAQLAGGSKVKSLTSCDVTLDGLTTTQYSLSKKATTINQLHIARVFAFAATETSGTLRAYVPRLPLASYPVVLLPDSTGVVQQYNAGNCGFNCEVSDWNHAWVALDDGHGDGLVILRNAVRGPAAVVVIDNDTYSNSDNTSVGLVQPATGWSGSVAETEALCFYDATSWPAARRAAGHPPQGCTSP
jgi:hypothetical protein